MRWFNYVIAEDEIKLLATQKMWASTEDQPAIVAEIEKRFNVLCDEVDEKEMDEMIRRTIERQIGMIEEGSPLAPNKTPPPNTKLDAAVAIPPELLAR